MVAPPLLHREGTGVGLCYRPIRLVNISHTKHLVEACKSLACASEHHQSANGTVKTMHNAKENISRLLILDFDIVLDGL